MEQKTNIKESKSYQVGYAFEMYLRAEHLFMPIFESISHYSGSDGFGFGQFINKTLENCPQHPEYQTYDDNCAVLDFYEDPNIMKVVIDVTLSELGMRPFYHDVDTLDFPKKSTNLAAEFKKNKELAEKTHASRLEKVRREKANSIRETITNPKIITILEKQISKQGWAAVGGFGCCCVGGACSDMDGYQHLLQDLVDEWKEKGVTLRITNIKGITFEAFEYKTSSTGKPYIQALANVPSYLDKYPTAEELLKQNELQ